MNFADEFNCGIRFRGSDSDLLNISLPFLKCVMQGDFLTVKWRCFNKTLLKLHRNEISSIFIYKGWFSRGIAVLHKNPCSSDKLILWTFSQKKNLQKIMRWFNEGSFN